METVKYFKKGEEVFIKCKVSGTVIAEDGLKYYLINPQTGRPFDWMFNADDLYPISENKEKTGK